MRNMTLHNVQHQVMRIVLHETASPAQLSDTYNSSAYSAKAAMIEHRLEVGILTSINRAVTAARSIPTKGCLVLTLPNGSLAK